MNRCRQQRRCRLHLLATGIVALPAALPASEDSIDAAIAAGQYEQAHELIGRRLQDSPLDEALRFRRARVLAATGDTESALRDYDELRSLHPDNVDYVFGRAQVLAWQGREVEALEELRIACRLAPDYEAVWRLRLQLLARQPADAGRAELGEARLAAGERFPDSRWWRAAPAGGERPWTLLLGGQYDSLSGSHPDWQHQFAEFRRAFERDDALFLRLDRHSRFDETDAQVSAGGVWQIGPAWRAGIDASTVSDAAFLPEIGYGVSAHRSFERGFSLGMRYRRREYPSATVDLYTADVEKYFGDFRAAWSTTISRLDAGADSPGHAAQLNWYPDDRSAFGISITFGEEAEAVDANRIVETEVRGLSVSGRHGVTDRADLHWWIGLHEQGDYYRRQYLGLAVSLEL